MTAVVPPRADQFAAFLCRLADELAAMGGTAELTAVGYRQDDAVVNLVIVDAGAAQRIAELMQLTEDTTRGYDRAWDGTYAGFAVTVVAGFPRPVSVASPVPLLHSGDVTEDAA